MENKNLIKALRDEFAPRIRELCADDKFDCDKLCAGNILTAQCIVFQAADALESQAAEIADLRAQLAEKDKLLKAAVEQMESAPLPDNKALTVEELREAADCGIPVWLVGVEVKNQWVRIDYVESLTIGFSAFGDDETWSFCAERYGKSVFAYRRQPEKGE